MLPVFVRILRRAALASSRCRSQQYLSLGLLLCFMSKDTWVAVASVLMLEARVLSVLRERLVVLHRLGRKNHVDLLQV